MTKLSECCYRHSYVNITLKTGTIAIFYCYLLPYSRSKNKMHLYPKGKNNERKIFRLRNF